MAVARIVMDGLINGASMCRYVYTIQALDVDSIANVDYEEYLDGMWTSTFLGKITSIWSNQRAIIEKPVAGKWVYQKEFAYVKVGTGAGGNDALPNQVAAVVVGITPSRRRGKKFIYGGVEGNAGAGQWNSDFLTALASFADAYTAPFTGEGSEWDNGVCKPDGSDFLAFNGFRVDAIAGTQRRRKQGVGR